MSDFLSQWRPETLTATRCQLLANAIDFQGERLEPDATKGYVEFFLAHAYPVVTAYGSAFAPETVRRSYRSMRHQVFDLRHAVASYFKGTHREIREDRIIGSVVGVEFPRMPLSGWALTDAESSPGIRGVAVIHKQAKGMDAVLGQHQTGRHEWTVSLEVDYRLSESDVLLVPGEHAEELPPFATTPPLYAKAGLHCVPFVEAPEAVTACFDEKRGMFTRHYKGWRPVVLLGGANGQVHFKGVGLVEYGAEPAARVGQLLASDPAAATWAKILEHGARSMEAIKVTCREGSGHVVFQSQLERDAGRVPVAASWP